MTNTEFKAMNNWEKIRMLTGMFPDNPQIMQGRLALCCLISRVELGDADPAFLDKTIDDCFEPGEDNEPSEPEQLELPIK